jgi:hypothetical protein
VSNVPIKEPQLTRTVLNKRSLGDLQTGDSGKGPKKSDQNRSEPERTGKNRNRSEKNFGQPKITSGVMSCLVKTADSLEKHRKKPSSHPKKSIKSDVPVKEPQFVKMDRVYGALTDRWSDYLDNKLIKSSGIRNVPDKCEDLAEVSDL